MSNSRTSQLLTLALIAGFFVLVSVLYLAERGMEHTNIHSFWDALWYAVVTLTTVGYGDFFPVTAWGRIAGLCLVLGSLGVLSVIIGKLTDNLIMYRETKRMGFYGTSFSGHIIIVGWDRFAERVAGQLVASNHRICIITEHLENVELIYEQFTEKTVFVLYADLHNQEVLDKVNVSKATALFPNLKDDARNLVYVINLRKKFPDLKIVMTLDNYDLEQTFLNAGVNYTISRNDVSSKMLASYIFEPDVAKFNEDLLASATGHDDFDVQQYKLVENSPFAGRLYAEVFDQLKHDLNVVPIGLSKLEDGEYTLYKLPTDDMLVEVDDYIVLITSGLRVPDLERLFCVKEGSLCTK